MGRSSTGVVVGPLCRVGVWQSRNQVGGRFKKVSGTVVFEPQALPAADLDGFA
jgi:hypothetical protein